MSDSLHLFVCPFLKKELEVILKQESLANLSLTKLEHESTFSSEKLVAFSDDLMSLRFGCASNIINMKKMLLEHHECIDLVMGKRSSLEYRNLGKQLLLPSMLTHLLHALETGTPKEHFSQLNNILVIDTKTHPRLVDEINRLKIILGIPISVLPISLDLMEQRIEMHAEIWQQYQNAALINENLFYAQKEKANYAIILDFINRTQRFETEKKILDDFLDLCVMISGTSDVYFKKDDSEFISFSQPLDQVMQTQIDLWIKENQMINPPFYIYPLNYRDNRLGVLIIKSEDQNRINMISTLLLALMNFTALALDKLRNMNQLAQQKELEAVHAMVATYNHEINNPLSIAVGYLNIADKKQDLKYLAEVRSALSKIEEIVRKISEITSKDLNFADYTKDSQRIKID